MSKPEKLNHILDGLFSSLQFKNILFICEKLKKNIELNRGKLPAPIYDTLMLRVEAIKLCTGKLLEFDENLLSDIILDSLINIDKILNRINDDGI